MRQLVHTLEPERVKILSFIREAVIQLAPVIVAAANSGAIAIGERYPHQIDKPTRHPPIHAKNLVTILQNHPELTQRIVYGRAFAIQGRVREPPGCFTVHEAATLEIASVGAPRAERFRRRQPRDSRSDFDIGHQGLTVWVDQSV